MLEFNYANELYKDESRAEIRRYREGKVSDSNMGRIADNNWGQNERLIDRLGVGSIQYADKVNLPGVGISVRKSQQYNMPLEHYVNHPDFQVMKELQKYRQDNNTHGGFSSVHKVDENSGLHFHELVQGNSLRGLQYSPETYDRLHAHNALQNFVQTPDPNPHLFHDMNKKVTKSMAKTVQHLQNNGFPNTWDYAKNDNVMLDNRQGELTNENQIRSIDAQGSLRGEAAVEQVW